MSLKLSDHTTKRIAAFWNERKTINFFAVWDIIISISLLVVNKSQGLKRNILQKLFWKTTGLYESGGRWF